MATEDLELPTSDGPAPTVTIKGGERQQQRGGQVRWNCSVVVMVFALFFLAMGGAPTPVQSLHHQSDLFSSRMSVRNLVEVNATAKYSNSWRTGFHFQPKKNWMNDPNGPLYYKGYYHLFYQYDPFSALWGNITWGHTVSKDLIHWQYLDDAAIGCGPGWYDFFGAWSGSATILEDGTPAMLYTGFSSGTFQIQADTFQIQTQNLALPVDPTDPLLRRWYKSESNPVIQVKPFMDANNFRDPTEAWRGKDGEWRILVGSKEPSGGGQAFVYKSKDFVNWTYVHPIHSVEGTGMWECPDFYPVAVSGKRGLHASVRKFMHRPVKHVMKVSLQNNNHDYYTVGMYDENTDTFTADDKSLDVGVGLRYDYGKFYASKTFFDHKTNRRILWGWISESTADFNAIIAGWSGLQGIPRQLWLDPDTLADLVQTPVEELDGLHLDKESKKEFRLSAGSVLPLAEASGAQLDIQVQFYKPDAAMEDPVFNATDIGSTSALEVCIASGGAVMQGFHGPFGLLVLADKEFLEQTAVYFYLATPSSSPEGKWQAIFCSDQSRSSLQVGVDETIYGTYVRVLETDEYLTLRTLVDRSIVESFVQGGRTVITSRVYPTVAINDAAQAYLFNNGTTDIQVHSIDTWKMASIDIVQFEV